LIAGERRLCARQSLGRKTVPVTVIDLNQIVRGEFAENIRRHNDVLDKHHDMHLEFGDESTTSGDP
jgi:ParB-like chromosome segregation protein Spo0J